MKDYIRRHPLLTRQSQAGFTQCLPQFFLLWGNDVVLDVARGWITAHFFSVLCRLQSQRHRLFTFQYRLAGGREFEPTKAFDVHAQKAGGSQLPEYALPLQVRKIATDAECGQPVVAKLANLVGGFS